MYQQHCLASALHVAARNKQNFALKTLLTAVREANDPVGLEKVINAQNVRGQTPLHCAVRAGDADCVHYLVTHYLGEVYNEAIYKEILETSVTEESSGKNPNDDDAEEINFLASKNTEGYTPAHIAVRKLKLGLLEAFVEAGAPVDVPDNNGETPLISAVQLDDTDIATLLIKVNQCNVNAVSNNKETPLWIACRKKNLLLIGRLLDAGADTSVPDKDGKLMKDIEDEEVQNVLNGYRVQPPEAHSEINSELPSSSSNRDNDQAPHFSAFSYRLPTMSADDISSMDYLTRLRLSKLLDADDKWAKLAEQLGCQNMVEFIRICADENSSPTMILLDQYEQVPNANLTTVAKSLEEMGETAASRLLQPPKTDEE
ncbi:unnamed protein product [Enterobius vermicularis]|uniref:ANK_REP_REGION domain-containing protein n=1 Tax=Enterobius vermicularis TaxID=51028 RepID=A0A0N4V9W6_ENTVE|nr:unnamed protein product [Enterobius vermicularis]